MPTDLLIAPHVTSEYHPRTADRFNEDTAEHELTILRDEDLYRHLRFRKPGTRTYGFDLVTWPGFLTVTGDMGTWVFTRELDMIEFFAGSREIEPRYWGEKLVSGDTSGRGHREYSEATVRASVETLVREHVEMEGLDEDAERRLQAAVAADIWPYTYDAREVYEALCGFEAEGLAFTDVWEWDMKDFTHQFLWVCFALQWGVATYLSTTR